MTTDGGELSLGAPRFDVVLRGYDRRQVDEHVGRLQRVISRLRTDLEVARSQAPPPQPTPPRGFAPRPAGYPPGQPGARSRPSPRPRPPGQPEPDVVEGFTDRMQSILQAAEEEAAEIRRKARSSRPDEDLRAQVADLVGQRDTVMGELAKMRGQIEALMAGTGGRSPGEVTGPAPQVAAPAALVSPEPAPEVSAAAQPLPGTSGPAQAEPDPSAPQAAAGPAAGEVPEPKGAHRLPTGEYRSVGERFGSLRPRSEPEPEPSELFRSRAEPGAPAGAEPALTADAADERAATAPIPDADATVKVGAVRPADAGPAANEEKPTELPRRASGSRASASRSR